MDKTKAHDKHADVDSTTGQPGDMSRWQWEMFKKLVAGGTLDSDMLAPPYLSQMPWSYPQHLWSHPLHLAQSLIPQSPGQTHRQDKEHEGQQGAAEPLPSDKSQPPHRCEMPGPSSGRGCYPFHSMSADANYDDLQNMSGTRPPYSYPGGFTFPSPPFPGQLDPLMLWMHHMQRQAAYLYSMPGHRNGYQSPLPVPLSAGANRRGFIKIPSGIPQKQTQLWETQSSENMQLWAMITQLCATVSRVEAEILCQRGKISKLEDDLEVMKTRQDALSEALKGTTVSPQARRERKKRTAVAILGLPAFQPLKASAQVKKARGSKDEADSLKSTSAIAAEGNCEQAHQDNALALTDGCTQNGNGNCSSQTVGLNQCESRMDTMDEDMAEKQLTIAGSSCGGMIDSALGQANQNGSLPVERTRETYNKLQNMEIKQECITGSMKNEEDGLRDGADSDGKKDEACVIESNTNQTLHSGNFSRDAACITENKADQRADPVGASIYFELAEMGGRNNRLEGVAITSNGDSTHRGLPSSNNSLARPNETHSGNAVADWHHGLQNGQVGTSAQRDTEAEAMNACTLDGFDGTDEWTQ